MQYSKEGLSQAYRQMAIIRAFEERLHTEIMTGEIAGFTHLYAGQEAVAVGICEHLDHGDKIVSTHRGHGHCIAKGCDVKGMMRDETADALEHFAVVKLRRPSPWRGNTAKRKVSKRCSVRPSIASGATTGTSCSCSSAANACSSRICSSLQRPGR